MLSQVNELLAKVPRDSGALVITGREGLFSGGFDLKTLATGDMEKITKMVQLGYRLLLELYSFDRHIDPLQQFYNQLNKSRKGLVQLNGLKRLQQ